MSAYTLAPRGVVENATGKLILPHMVEWADYLAWLSAGGELDPMPVVVSETTQAEIDAQAELTARAAMRGDLRADATLQFLRAHTPAEVAAWVNSNVTDLASAKMVLSKLAMICAYLARERFQHTD